jgi:hypothetical protein
MVSVRATEEAMQVQPLISGTSFGPDALKVVTQAFDEAWSAIADRYKTPDETEAARIQLANATLAVATEASRDVEVLKQAALEVMRGMTLSRRR